MPTRLSGSLHAALFQNCLRRPFAGTDQASQRAVNAWRCYSRASIED
jgi:hypothetical protein